MNELKTMLGIELGSTRIKAVTINEQHVPVSSGDYTWKSSYENGVWTYDLAEVWKGLKTALSGAMEYEYDPHFFRSQERSGETIQAYVRKDGSVDSF